MRRIQHGLLAFLLTLFVGGSLLAADTKISDMTAVSSLATADIFPVVQGGANKKATVGDVKTYIETGGTVTASDPVLDLTQTWNNGAVTFIGFHLTVTDTTSAAASSLARFTVGATVVSALSKGGAFEATNVAVSSAGAIGWNSSTTIPGTQDTFLYRDAAGTISQRNSTNAQQFQLFNTYTDGSNYERMTFKPAGSGSGVMQILTETAGTGTDNISLSLVPSGTGGVMIPSGLVGTPSLRFSADTDTGFYYVSTGGSKIAFAVNGVQEMLMGSTEVDIANDIDFATSGGQYIYGLKWYTEANTAGSGAPNVLAASETFTQFTNEGTTAVNYHTLPTAAVGLEFTFIVQDVDGLRITANTGDTIRVIDKVTAAAGYIQSTTIGSVVELRAINATEWIAVTVHGVWTDGTFTFDDTSLTTP